MRATILRTATTRRKVILFFLFEHVSERKEKRKTKENSFDFNLGKTDMATRRKHGKAF